MTQMTINAIGGLGGEVTASGRKTLINSTTKTGMFTQSMLVDAQKKKQGIQKALTELNENPAAQFWLHQLE